MTDGEAIRIILENQSGARTRMLENAAKNPAYAETQMLDCEAFDHALAAMREKAAREKMILEAKVDFGNWREPIKLEAAIKSERMKFNYRRVNRPQDISILDYTIIFALEEVLSSIEKKAGPE